MQVMIIEIIHDESLQILGKSLEEVKKYIKIVMNSCIQEIELTN